MLCALGYDPKHDVTMAPALEERSTTYDDNVFRVVRLAG
jgi:hypothetical protein